MQEKPKFKFKDGVAFSKEIIEGGLIKLTIYHDGQIVGESVLQLFTDDNTYYICGFNIIPDEQGKKNGSNLIEGVNDFIKSQKGKGLLENTIDDKGLRDIYLNHGWKQQVSVSGMEVKDFFVYEPEY